LVELFVVVGVALLRMLDEPLVVVGVALLLV
jgi:hypothetical protein